MSTEPEIASFEDLTSGADGFETVKLASGKAVRVRGLSRYEYLLAGKRMNGQEQDIGAFEVAITQLGLVEPKLTPGQVLAWQKSAGAFQDFQRVHEAIARLCGIGEGADKSDDQEVSD